jgi:tRNA-dihydrouridine synthase B
VQDPATRIYLAPMRGFTDALYRKTYAEFFGGVDGAVAPFIPSVRGERIKPSHLKDVLPRNNDGRPLVPQVLSKSSAEFIVMARALHDLGYATVNWNLGCPYPMVAKKGRGSGLLPFPERIEAFLDQVLGAIPNRLSIKTRLGRQRSDDILKLLPIFNRYPLKEIIIHPRTGVQMYTGSVDVDGFVDCLALSAHPLVYNGDIVGLPSYQALKQRLPQVTGWMIGRGILANPFLPAMIKTGCEALANPMKTFKAFHDTLVARYGEKLSGPAHLLQRMKGLWFYLYRPFADGQHLLRQIRRSKTIEGYREVVGSAMTQEGRWSAEGNVSGGCGCQAEREGI